MQKRHQPSTNDNFIIVSPKHGIYWTAAVANNVNVKICVNGISRGVYFDVIQCHVSNLPSASGKRQIVVYPFNTSFNRCNTCIYTISKLHPNTLVLKWKKETR
jgi:hypothetical protein